MPHSPAAPSRRELLPLVGLTLSAFLLNTSELVPIGLLTDIAAAFSLSESGAALMISLYAWAVALLSLPLMLAASRVAPRRLILAVLAVFAAGQVGAGVGLVGLVGGIVVGAGALWCATRLRGLLRHASA